MGFLSLPEYLWVQRCRFEQFAIFCALWEEMLPAATHHHSAVFRRSALLREIATELPAFSNTDGGLLHANNYCRSCLGAATSLPVAVGDNDAGAATSCAVTTALQSSPIPSETASLCDALGAALQSMNGEEDDQSGLVPVPVHQYDQFHAQLVRPAARASASVGSAPEVVY